MLFKVKDGFKSDKPSKEQFIEATTAFWNEKAPYLKLEWYGVDSIKDAHNNVIDFKIVPLGSESDKANLDLAMKVTSLITGMVYWYVIELKERFGKYTSKRYGEAGCEGWIVEPEKYNVLTIAMSKGYIPVYGNLYPDDVIRIWRIDKLLKIDAGYKFTPKHSVVVDSPKEDRYKLFVYNNDSQSYRRWTTAVS